MVSSQQWQWDCRGKLAGNFEPLYGPEWNTKMPRAKRPEVSCSIRLETLDDAMRTRTVPNRERTTAGFPL
jgi:hypothetical protein